MTAKAAIARTTALKGNVVNPTTEGGLGGRHWADMYLTSHLQFECTLLSASADTLAATAWQEAPYTFDRADAKTGLEVSGVFCACSKVYDRKVRWETSAAEILHLVLTGDIP